VFTTNEGLRPLSDGLRRSPFGVEGRCHHLLAGLAFVATQPRAP